MELSLQKIFLIFLDKNWPQTWTQTNIFGFRKKILDSIFDNTEATRRNVGEKYIFFTNRKFYSKLTFAKKETLPRYPNLSVISHSQELHLSPSLVNYSQRYLNHSRNILNDFKKHNFITFEDCSNNPSWSRVRSIECTSIQNQNFHCSSKVMSSILFKYAF